MQRKTTTILSRGPITMGREPSSRGYVVADARTGARSWFSDKASATRAFNNKCANLRAEAPAPAQAVRMALREGGY